MEQCYANIIESICYLDHQVRKRKDGADSNFSQLLLLRGIDCPAFLVGDNGFAHLGEDLLRYC